MTSNRFTVLKDSTISLVNASSFNDVSNALDQSRKLYVLNGENIVDTPSFLIEFTKQFLEMGEATNLSNLKDIFRNNIMDDPASRTAFIWTHVDNMLDGSLWDFISLCSLLSDISRKVSSGEDNHINVFVGSGTNFPLPNQL